ncbi:LysM peptidoglycan-binding domain-containing protein [Sulfurospirillum sp. 1307]|jgi:membrane-bound lytic murein transglycosylase D
MFKFLFSFLLLVQSGFAFLSTQNDYQEQAKVLKSLDISPTFMTDLVFMKMKDDADRYRTKHFLKVLENGNRFIPVLQNMLHEAGIPEAFLYLAMAESNFVASAYSRARAVGIWQFMPYTARKFGLKIDLYVDERRDPIKSTQAAIKYLKYLHKRFGKWYLAAIAYNCGEGRVDRAIKRAKSDDLRVLLNARKKYIPRESRLYIRKIMMMQYISNSTDFIVGHDASYLMNRGTSHTFTKVYVKSGATLSAIADSIGMSYKELKSYNPHLRYGFTPPTSKKYHIYIPYGKESIFKANYDPKKDSGRFYVHRIKRGDSLYSIGKRYGVSYKLIKDFNKLHSNILRVNKTLIIPVLKPKTRNYIIKNGDTIGAISRKFNVAISDILKLNNKKNSMIRVGEKIVIPNIY